MKGAENEEKSYFFIRNNIDNAVSYKLCRM